MSSILYLEVSEIIKRIDDKFVIAAVPLETLLTLCVYKYCNISDVKLSYILTKCRSDVCVSLEVFSDDKNAVLYPESTPWLAKSCRLPSIVQGTKCLSSGGAAAARRLVKLAPSLSHGSVHPDGLLGFRASCLQAPNETSVWTKFCEIEIVRTTVDFIKNLKNGIYSLSIPKDVVRFECHLSKPLQIHNVYKLARAVANLSVDEKEKNLEQNTIKEIDGNKSPRANGKSRKWKSKNKAPIIESSTPIEQLGLVHKFAEGPYLTLADVLLYPCFNILFSNSNPSEILQFVPLAYKWMQEVSNLREFQDVNSFLEDAKKLTFENLNTICIKYTSIPTIDNVSLYKCDPKRTNKKKKAFTKEDDIELALKFVDESKLECDLEEIKDKGEVNWEAIPLDANPFGGYLPQDRMLRKRQQLENLASIVVKIAKGGDKIVDFCSGGGHLGILLGHLLPKCTIILLENKEESMKRARMRVEKLGLENIFFFQSNLDFFIGDFDIGVALHACGVSTDLVLDNCTNKNASFVICPCCYGSLHQTDRLNYPRSKEFNEMPIEQYLCIGHAADQTHTDHPMEKRGSRCMQIIDSDRARQAMNFGYSVSLSRLKPLSCTPKNMIIVGTPSTE